MPPILPSVCLGLALACVLVAPVTAHDTYLRFDDPPVAGATVPVIVFNGTFDSSVDSIAADGVREFGWLCGGERTVLDAAAWKRGEAGTRMWRVGQRVVGFFGGLDLRRTSSFSLSTPGEGSGVTYVTLHPSRTAMDPDKWLSYMGEEGLRSEPQARFEGAGPEAIIRERYTKSAKALVQIGSAITDDPLKAVGQPAEIVPLAHPTTYAEDGTAEFLILKDGSPLAGQVVLYGQEAGDEADDERHSARSGADGRITVTFDDDGEWWIRFVHVARLPVGGEVDFETTWATLTFFVP